MALLKVIIRKMLNNRWLTGSLFLGLIITVSLVSSIPTYTSSVMQKLLQKDLQEYQIKYNDFPGEFTFSDTFANTVVSKPSEALNKVEKIKDNIIKDAGLPILADVNVIMTGPLKVTYEAESRSTSSQRPGRMMMMTDLFNHITLSDGKLPSKTIKNGVMEVLVSEDALAKRDMVLGSVFLVGESNSQFKVRPVGTFKPKNERDPYWSVTSSNFSEDFIVHEDIFRNEIIKKHEDLLGIGRFSAAFDYHKIDNQDIATLVGLVSRLETEVSEVKESTLLTKFPIQDVLKSYGQKEKQLSVMLWSLNVPVLVMLGLYLYMVSRLIIGRQLNEIAILSSRGASRSKILVIYFIEVSILGITALILGPFIGLLLVKILGTSNGFLEFIQRTNLPVKIMPKAFGYALLAVIASISMIMIPVYQASKESIVNHKQKLARLAGSQQWYTIIIDFSLIGISLYGLNSFINRQEELQSLKVSSGELYIDPALFFIPALFIIGLGLIILRIYPWILKGIYKLGENIWSVSLYSTFLQVSRSFKQYQFLMLFLVMTIGIGMFSASAARTINNNLEEQIRYENGADVRMEVRWDSNKPTAMPVNSAPTTENSNNGKTEEAPEEVVYSEPKFKPFTDLKGVQHATKVFNMENVISSAKGKSINGSTLMAIESKDFGETAWFKPSLLPQHWFRYLNLLAKEPSAVLISQNLAAKLGVKPGDYLTVDGRNSDKGEFVVYGIIDYWPTYNPLKKDEENENSDSSLIVANLSYVQNMMGLEPYQVWLKLKTDTKRSTFYNDIQKRKIPVTMLEDVYPKVTDLKNSSLLLGLNGTMTLGFLISIIVSLIGFLLYWVLTIKSRTLQYGIYRAMGIPMTKLIGILTWEQLVTSGFACILGIVAGKITSHLFVPLFKLSLNAQELVPPFAVVFNPGDEAKIYLFVSIMLVIGLTILVIFLRKIRIHQALKLGED